MSQGIITEVDLDLTDNSVANSSTSKHGFLAKLSGNSAHYMNGSGAWTVPPDTTYIGSLGIELVGNSFRPSYGTLANTVAQGNDSRINNGQTAFTSLVNYLPLAGGSMTNTNLVSNLNADLLGGKNYNFIRDKIESRFAWGGVNRITEATPSLDPLFKRVMSFDKTNGGNSFSVGAGFVLTLSASDSNIEDSHSPNWGGAVSQLVFTEGSSRFHMRTGINGSSPTQGWNSFVEVLTTGRFTTTASDIKVNGTQSVGSSLLVARADHVHPVDTSRQESLSGSGIVKSVAGTISYLTDNSTNWNNAFTERAQWDGGALNLVAATGRSSLGLSNVDNTTDISKPVSTAQGVANTATLNAAKAYADSIVVGLWDDRGSYNASGNIFPSTGGSGASGAVMKGDIWTISVAGTLGGIAVILSDTVRAVSDNPGQTSSNWTTAEGNLGYIPYNSTNPAGYTANAGTVTSVAQLTISATGTDITSSVATNTTTPVITLIIPTASAVNRGALSSVDWSTFNGKQANLGFTPYNATNPSGYTSNLGTVTGVTATGPVLSTGGTSPVISMPAATTAVAGHLTAADWNIFNSKQPAGSYLTGTKVDSFNTRTGAVTLSSGDVTTALSYTPVQPNGTGATGTWAISITLNAATASTAALFNSRAASTFGDRYTAVADVRAIAIGTGTSYGFFDSSLTPANSPTGADSWVQGIQTTAGNGNLNFRQLLVTNGSDYYINLQGNSTWGSWRKLFDSGNFISGIGTSNWTRGDDPRLSDARTPISHTHTKAQITDFAHTHEILTRGLYLTGADYNGGSAQSWAVDATVAATASKVVARDSNGYIFATYLNSSNTPENNAASNYSFDIGDGYHRRKSLANVRAEIVTSAAISSALGYTPANAALYLLLTGGSLSGSLNVPTFSSLSANASFTNYAQGNNTTLLAQTPMTGIWHDLFAFGKAYTTTFETSVNETTWVAGTTDKKLFSQKQNQTVLVLDYTTTKSVRWTFNNVAWGGGQWLVIGFTWQPVAANKTVVVESSMDNITYTERHRSTFSNTADTVHLFVNSYSGDQFLRVRIIWNSGNGNIALSSIKLLSARPGDQGLGKELEYPYVWDENQKVTFSNEVVATTFTGDLAGNATTSTTAATATTALNSNLLGNIASTGFMRTRGTLSGDIDADWGEGVVTFDPLATGTLPVSSPNIRVLNLGSNFTRRTQVAFPWDADRAFFRRSNGSWAPWREFIHSGNIGTQTVANANYATSAGTATDNTKLPLIGGTLTGALRIESPVLGAVVANTSTQAVFYSSTVNGSELHIQDYRTAAGNDWNFAGKRIQEKIDNTWMGYIQFNGTGNNGGISFGTGLSTTQSNVLEVLKLSSTGAATFTSSVTATDGIFSGDIKGNGAATLKTIWGGAFSGAVQIKTDGSTTDRYVRVGMVNGSGVWNGGLTIANDLSATFSSSVTSSGQLIVNNNSGLILRNNTNASWVTLGFNGSQLTCNYDILATAFLGNASSATNIANTGTVMLGSPTESNSITITQPTIAVDKPVKLLNFDWYGNSWSLGNIRTSSTGSAGFGIFEGVTERFRVAPGGASTFTSSVTAVSFFATSDMRLKTLVDKVHTNSVSNIEEISYLWKDTSMGTAVQVGYDASNVKEHMPNAVNTDYKGMLSVNYIQVLVAKVAFLEQQIKKLNDAI